MIRTNQRTIFLLALLLAAPLAASAAEQEAPRFNRDIRPILAQTCFHCHGPDENQRQADLRFDQEEGLAYAFVGGDLAGSEAWQRITSEDPDLRMPPADAPHQIKPAQIETIRRWIQAGAQWEGHWSFIPPTRPALPETQQAERVTNEIDAFILARLEQEGLQASEPADRERLLRRVTFDLTGLPPTLAEIEAFLADDSPDAYETVVDRLLASPRYGERMTLAWLDAARYGDSSVFHADGPRDMWGWRDWVINAYNTNKPFDQFTVEQLAGDLLPEASRQQKIATGFLRNNATTDEGGVIPEEFRVEYAIDRVKTTSVVWMGLTMECGQCHSHKYDPITQHEYYRFFAYFNQSADPGMQSRRGNQAPLAELFDPQAIDRAADLQAKLTDLETKLNAYKEQSQTEFLAWAESVAQDSKQSIVPEDMLLHVPLDDRKGNEVTAHAGDESLTLNVQGKPLWTEGQQLGAFRFEGSNYIDAGDIANFERTDSFSYGAWIKPQGKASGAPLARMDDGNSHRGFDLYTASGKVAVHIINTWPGNALKVTTNASLKPDQWQHVFATYDGSSKASGVKVYFDGEEQPWSIEQDGLTDTIRTDKTLYLGRRNPGSPFKGEVDDVRIYPRQLSAVEVQALAGSNAVTDLLAKPQDQWTEAEQDTLYTYYLNNHDETYREQVATVNKLKAEIATAEKPISTVMVMDDVDKPRMTYVLDRGSYDAPLKDQPVQPGVPAALPPLAEDSPPNRLGLAQWLVRPDHPLTARVAVNRYWYLLFGKGLVRTLEDFGSQGQWPSHPKLLDWLAVDFQENGWNVKRTIKLMVMSSTYRQSSRVTPELLAADPENLLLARGPRFRLQGEFIRDNALAASGLLVDEIGGPSVKPYQPPGLWNEVSLSGARFVQDKQEKLYRRSMYTYWKRSAPSPSLTIFDAPTRESCVLRRSRTNTPLQALVTMNDPQFVEAARVLAGRVIEQKSDSAHEQIALAYRLATGLKPSEATVAALHDSYQEELKVFTAEPERAKKLLSVGEARRNEEIPPAEHAAMSVTCSLILNLDVTLTRS